MCEFLDIRFYDDEGNSILEKAVNPVYPSPEFLSAVEYTESNESYDRLKEQSEIEFTITFPNGEKYEFRGKVGPEKIGVCPDCNGEKWIRYDISEDEVRHVLCEFCGGTGESHSFEILDPVRIDDEPDQFTDDGDLLTHTADGCYLGSCLPKIGSPHPQAKEPNLDYLSSLFGEQEPARLPEDVWPGNSIRLPKED